MASFELRFCEKDICALAERYLSNSTASEREREDLIEKRIAPAVKGRGYFTRADLLTVCRWKTPRSQSRCAENSSAFIKEVTRVALSTRCEQLRIEVLTVLRGVEWPTASVLLHFGHRSRYPILDFRALDSLQVAVPKAYTFEFWWAYTTFCRRLSHGCAVDMRTLDRALWQYSKEHG
jgi:hypothetical protein